MNGPMDDDTTYCHGDPFGEDGSDFELWPPPDPDEFEYYNSTDLLT
jgi:hypothetical protein